MGKEGKKARAKARSERKSGGSDDGAPPPPPTEAPPPAYDGLLPDLPPPPTHAPGGGEAKAKAKKKRDPNALPRRPVLPDDPGLRRLRREVAPADVASLPLAASEVWQLLLADGFVLVGDTTDALWGVGQGMRPLLAGPLPDLTTPVGWKNLAGLVLGAMANPRDGEESPRRPARVLIDPSFPPGTTESIRAEVTAANVRVEGGSPDDVLSAVADVLYRPSLAECSWGASARGPYKSFGPEGGANMLLTWAMCLPKKDDEVWSAGVYLVEGPQGNRPHLVVERIYEGPELPEEKKEELLVGGGPVPVALVHHALLAAMLCPMHGEKRRPGKVVFQPDLAGQLGSYQGTLKEVGVEVLLGTNPN